MTAPSAKTGVEKITFSSNDDFVGASITSLQALISPANVNTNKDLNNIFFILLYFIN